MSLRYKLFCSFVDGKSICTIRSDYKGLCRSGTNRLFLLLLVHVLCGQIILLVMAVCFQSPGLGVVLGFKGIADGGVKPKRPPFCG